jgi:hypothetical protein
VREITGMQDITAMPQTPAYVKGTSIHTTSASIARDIPKDWLAIRPAQAASHQPRREDR